MSIFDFMTYTKNPIDLAWVEYKRKTTQLSPHEMVALNRRVRMIWPAFDGTNGILQSEGEILVYTPMRLRSFLFPIVFWHVRRQVNLIIDRFVEDFECNQRRIVVKHVFYRPKNFTLPLMPIPDIEDVMKRIESEWTPFGFVERTKRSWEKIKKAI